MRRDPKVWDVDGNEIVDLWMGHYTHLLGHHADVIVEAIERQVKEGIHWGIVFEKQIEWAELIQELIPCAEMVRFCCSGTEATMYAVRLARAYTGKNTILKIAGGWHGANPDLTLAIKSPYEKRESLGLTPDLEQFTKAIPFNDIPGTREIIHQNKKDLAGIIHELAPGEGGFVPATPDYLKMLRSETEASGALLIFDEVITGFRLSLGGGQKRLGVTPDLTTLGKIVGGGTACGRRRREKRDPGKNLARKKRKQVGKDRDRRRHLLRPSLDGGSRIGHASVSEGSSRGGLSSIESKGEKVREGVQAALRRNGVKATVTGIGSLFQTHFPNEEGVVLNSPQSINQFYGHRKKRG